MNMATSTLTGFLAYASNQREVSLVIAKNDQELARFCDELNALGVVAAKNPLELLSHAELPGKMYGVVAGVADAKDYYDFAIQYPTGQVEIWNRETMQPHGGTPCYEGVSLLLLITKENVTACQKNGMDFLASTGLVFQS